MTLPVFLDGIQTARKVCTRSQKAVYEFISSEIQKKIVGKMSHLFERTPTTFAYNWKMSVAV